MSQNRQPPAYQEYAAAMMAKVEYRVLNLSERGLLYTLRLECWVNHSVPQDPAILARVLGLDLEEIAAALPAVMPFFAADNGKLYCPELEDYRAHLQSIRDRQAEGGKRAAAVSNSKRKTRNSSGKKGLSVQPPGNSPGNSQVTCESLVQPSSAHPSQETGTFTSGVHGDRFEMEF